MWPVVCGLVQSPQDALEAATHCLARAVQHETDHLNGILFIDRIAADKKEKIEQKMLKKALKKED